MGQQKRAEKPYFNCGPEVEKANKNAQDCLWKEVEVSKTMIIVIIAMLVIMIKMLATLITIAIWR